MDRGKSMNGAADVDAGDDVENHDLQIANPLPDLAGSAAEAGTCA